MIRCISTKKKKKNYFTSVFFEPNRVLNIVPLVGWECYGGNCITFVEFALHYCCLQNCIGLYVGWLCVKITYCCDKILLPTISLDFWCNKMTMPLVNLII